VKRDVDEVKIELPLASVPVAPMVLEVEFSGYGGDEGPEIVPLEAMLEG